MDAANPHAQSVLTLARAIVRTAVVPVLLTVGVGAALGAVLVGTAGLYGALVGGGVALASSMATILMMRWSAGFPPMFVMVVALGGFALKLVVLLGVMMALRGVDALHPMSLALTFLAAVLMWVAAEAFAFRRTKIPTVIVGGE